MKVTLIWIGKIKETYILTGIDEYVKRLTRYVKLDIIEIPYIKKKLSEDEIKMREGEQILKHVSLGSHLALLDENGMQYSSVKFSKHLEQLAIGGTSQITFVVGGAYGFSDEVYAKAHSKISLSPMTFNHQMVRMIFLEQLYRAQTILNNEPYHHA